jgi:FGGY-family pentulose kinase
MSKFVVAVDVGTGSARAGVFDAQGKLLGHAKRPIAIRHDAGNVVEQDSGDIWRGVCASVREAIVDAGVDGSAISALAFDATCSLVLADRSGAPLPLTDDNWDVVVWMDQRASAEADECTATSSKVLDYLGGRMSPQMEIPKLMWLKRHRPDIWAKLAYAFDLADFLSWRATGKNERSVCTLGCKWTYLPAEAEGWQSDFLDAVGLEDVLAKAALPAKALEVGAPIGQLTPEAAEELGLSAQCVVATGLIDAHAGALGTLLPVTPERADRVLALIAGSSNCHMALSQQLRRVDGIWGPYPGAVLADWWLNEGGQSASGLLLDWVVQSCAATKDMDKPHDVLAAEILGRIAAGQTLPEAFHVVPDFRGNRAPFADANMLGAIVGLTITEPFEYAVQLYWATAAAIGYGTRQIIDRLNENGYRIDTLALSGGHAASPFLVQLYADTTGCTVQLPAAEEPVLLGTAIAARLGLGEDISSIAEAMVAVSRHVEPDATQRALHDARYARFGVLIDFTRSWTAAR